MVRAPIASKLKLHLQTWIDWLAVLLVLAIALKLPTTPLFKDPLESQKADSHTMGHAYFSCCDEHP